MLVGLSCRLVPIGDLVMVSRSVHNGSVVCDPLGISIHCPARFVQAPLYFPGELQYSFKHEARSPVWVALVVQYSLSVGVYSRFPCCIARPTSVDIRRSCCSAISPLHELPMSEYCALRLGAAAKWFCGSSCKLSRLLMCMGPDRVVSWLRMSSSWAQ